MERARETEMVRESEMVRETGIIREIYNIYRDGGDGNSRRNMEM
jgi:hypothetical protein